MEIATRVFLISTVVIVGFPPARENSRCVANCVRRSPTPKAKGFVR
jgi:hypothetical protein